MDQYTEEYRYGKTKIDRSAIPYVTIVLIAINIIIFVIMELAGSTEDSMFLYTHGAMYWPAVVEDGEWYRVFTHMFVHTGPEHLLNNMFLLGILGYQMERQYGEIKYLITYFFCGIVGAGVSAYVEMCQGEAIISIGASGAIFGLLGAFIVMILKRGTNIETVSAPQLLILLLLIIFGNMQEGVDWVAHLGGALMGLLMALVFYHPQRSDTFHI